MPRACFCDNALRTTTYRTPDTMHAKKTTKESAVPRTVLDKLSRSAAILALVGLAACQASDGTSQAPDTALVASLMSGLGAVDPKAKQIEYKPRAPLAMPAEPTALPQPETSVAGAQSEAWPENEKNQDLEDIKALYASASGRNPEVLSPEQMRGIRINGAPTGGRNLAADERSEELIAGDRMTAAEMRKQNASANDLSKDSIVATQNRLPKRRYLTDPPVAYSVPSADAPMPTIAKADNSRNLQEDYNSEPLDMRCLETSGGACER